MAESELLIRNVEIEGRAHCDLLVRDGRIATIGRRLATTGNVLEGCGGALIPGLHDHHIHLLATAARSNTIDLSSVRDAREAKRVLLNAIRQKPCGDWLRVAGYHEHSCGPMDRSLLDRLAPDHPVRLEHQSGSLWILNSRALNALGTDDAPASLERDAAGRPTGNLWRGDAWLKDRLGVAPPDLAALGRSLAAFGVTGATDTSPTTDLSAFACLSAANASGALPQKLLLMSGQLLAVEETASVRLGAVKFILDDHNLPDLGEVAQDIAAAHNAGRAVAVHSVTYGELAFALAALDMAGPQLGDRIEHGGLIARETLDDLRRMGLCVVTQPSFIALRGDRYLQRVEPEQWDDLYRCRTLLEAGVRVAASSDAPYGNLDPWGSLRAAVQRLTREGRLIGAGERLTPSAALDLFLCNPDLPGGPPRRLEVGAAADLCLLSGPRPSALAHLDASRVRATVIDGCVVYERPR